MHIKHLKKDKKRKEKRMIATDSKCPFSLLIKLKVDTSEIDQQNKNYLKSS